MGEKFYKIREVAKIFRVSIDTIRRLDKAGKIKSIRLSPKGHRYFTESELRAYFQDDLFNQAKNWVQSDVPYEPLSFYYCQTSYVFQSRLVKFDTLINKKPEYKKIASLVTSVAGEIGNNSFDHNLGQWPDIPGIFFSYSLEEKRIVLADRGLGILATLKRVRPDLMNHNEALKVAFTVMVSGRAPENRGNGLKYVRKVVTENNIKLIFISGDSELSIKKKEANLNISEVEPIRGCLALIEF